MQIVDLRKEYSNERHGGTSEKSDAWDLRGVFHDGCESPIHLLSEEGMKIKNLHYKSKVNT